MQLPELVQETLNNVGQVAVEVPSGIEDYREYVSVYFAKTEGIMNFQNSFPYFRDLEKVYRLIRFRVRSQLIELDANLGPDDLIDLQNIYLPDEKAVCSILKIWQVAFDQLLPPREVEIPV